MNDKVKQTWNETILIVDDMEINRAVLEAIISDMGCRPVLAESGEKALAVLRECTPQLILTDISMPGISGYELCGILKQQEDTRDIPIIFISAHYAPQNIVEGFESGGEDYITKPFIPEEVQARVGVHLRLHEVTQKLMETNRRLQVSISEQLRQMELEKKNILYALADIAANNSSYEKKYMGRLRHNCGILAQGMQLSPLFEEKISDTYIETVELAASLCDIGNIGVSKEILQKGAELTKEEEEAAQSHTKIGAKLLGDLRGSNDYNDFISISTDIAHYHHENWDGSGYPEGLKGDAIPLAAQIVSLVSRYCLLTEDGKCTREEAMGIMGEEAGMRFNPDIFEICCKISRQFC